MARVNGKSPAHGAVDLAEKRVKAAAHRLQIRELEQALRERERSRQAVAALRRRRG